MNIPMYSALSMLVHGKALYKNIIIIIIMMIMMIIDVKHNSLLECC